MAGVNLRLGRLKLLQPGGVDPVVKGKSGISANKEDQNKKGDTTGVKGSSAHANTDHMYTQGPF